MTKFDAKRISELATALGFTKVEIEKESEATLEFRGLFMGRPTYREETYAEYSVTIGIYKFTTFWAADKFLNGGQNDS